MNRILLTGKNGQIGWELQRTLATLGEVIALNRHQLDLANPDSIRRAVHEHKPDLIVNAAAYTAVDKAESEPDLAMAINGTGPGILAEEGKRLGAALIHYSTDYVFDGKKNGPYVEEDVPNPVNIYGKTKLAGEKAIQAINIPHLILRTSWVYGTRGNNFLLTILRLAREREELTIVNDQIGAPTWSRMIAEATAQTLMQFSSSAGRNLLATGRVAPSVAHDLMLSAELSGIYHITAANFTSWYGFASLVVETLKQQEKNGAFRSTVVTSIPSVTYPLPARRPKNSRLDNTRFTRQFGLVMPSWDVGVRMCLDELLINKAHCV